MGVVMKVLVVVVVVLEGQGSMGTSSAGRFGRVTVSSLLPHDPPPSFSSNPMLFLPPISPPPPLLHRLFVVYT